MRLRFPLLISLLAVATIASPTAAVDGYEVRDLAGAGATHLWSPTEGYGARRLWCDSTDRVWVAEWDAGLVALYDPATEE